jgi:MFS family permease
MKTLAARIIRTFGFRNIMVINAVVSSLFLAACALFTPATPLLLIMIILIVGGFFRSLQFTAINTLAYADVEPAEMSRATTLVSVNQQLAISAGVAVGALVVEATMLHNQSAELTASDFWPAFVVIAKLPEDAGHQVSGHKIPPLEGHKAPEVAASESTQEARDQKLG